MNLSFSGCGFLCIYHAGVAAAIKEYAPQLTQNKICGASAGSIVAAGLICDVCISKATSTILKIVTQARSRSLGPLHPAFNLLGLVREELEKTLPSNAYKLCNKRLQISLTRWDDNKNVVVDEYDSNEELIDAIICSCFIPVYCGLNAPTFRGVAYIDGGFTDNQPAYDHHSVSVSPFSGESDICPLDWDSASLFGISFSNTSIRFTTRNLFRLTACLMPPSTEDCSKMCLQGFEDALRFLARNGMAPCIRCLTVQTNFDQLITGIISIPADGRKGPSPQTTERSRLTSTRGTRRMEPSECEVCCESTEHRYPSDISEYFPKVLRATFDDAVAAETSMFQFLLSFKIVRIARTAMGISKLPLDMTFILAQNLLSIAAQAIAPEWLVQRLQSVVDFIMGEIEFQKSRYNRFSCSAALTEIEHKPYNQQPSHSREFIIEPSAEALRESAALRERDRRRSLALSKNNHNLAQDPAWTCGNEQDSLEHVITYTRHHEAMYEFHYLDENNKYRSFELFNIIPSGGSCHAGQGSGCNQSHRHHSAQRTNSIIIEEKEKEYNKNVVDRTTSTDNVINDDADSGVSGVEQTTEFVSSNYPS
ncbi:unnamed protein product [Auanema sp. JU1783]|nr:unnamed protein product [Auanema sp. JU1783]